MQDKAKRNEKIAEYRAKGYTLRAIAGIFHISPNAVWKILKRQEASVVVVTRVLRGKEN